MILLSWLFNTTHERTVTKGLLTPLVRSLTVFMVGASSLLLSAGSTVSRTAAEIVATAAEPIGTATESAEERATNTNPAVTDPDCANAETGVATSPHGCEQYELLQNVNREEYVREKAECGGCILVSVCVLVGIDFKFDTVVTDGGETRRVSTLICNYRNCGSIRKIEVLQ